MHRRKPVIDVIDDDMARILRAMSGDEKLRVADDMYRSARQLIKASVESDHPEWSTEQIQREVARRVAGDST